MDLSQSYVWYFGNHVGPRIWQVSFICSVSECVGLGISLFKYPMECLWPSTTSFFRTRVWWSNDSVSCFSSALIDSAFWKQFRWKRLERRFGLLDTLMTYETTYHILWLCSAFWRCGQFESDIQLNVLMVDTMPSMYLFIYPLMIPAVYKLYPVLSPATRLHVFRQDYNARGERCISEALSDRHRTWTDN